LADLNDGPQSVKIEVLRNGREGQANCQAEGMNYEDLPCAEIRPAIPGDRFQVAWLTHTRRVLSQEPLTR
jgi:hypothetical protein